MADRLPSARPGFGRAVSPRLQQEDGFALLLALGITIVLAILVTSMISYTSSGTRSSATEGGQQMAVANAESAANGAVSFLAAKLAANGDPSAANLLGCNGATGPADTNGPSNCSAPTVKVICLPGAASCTAGSAGTASLYGYYSGTSGGTYLSQTVPPSTWLLVSTGYATNTAATGVIAHTSLAEIKVNPVSSGAVAALWNHVFLTAPLVPNVCQTDFENGNIVIDMSMYVLGNLCMQGDHIVIKEVGQAVDFQVGGKFVINSGSSNTVGVSAAIPITSGVVVGGCINGSVTATGSPCGPAYKYWVTTLDTFNPQAAPTQTTTDIQADYNSFDPGPKHACLAGTNPAPLASTVFDNNTIYDSSAASFELTPAFSYACISQSGAGTGYLIWNNGASPITVSGITVPAKGLAINGSIFFDGNVTIAQSIYYTGVAIIEASGTITVNNTGTNVCATSPCNTALNAWQGSSGNNSMLTFAPCISNSADAMRLNGDNTIVQASVWTQPSSQFLLNGANETIEGPLSVGSLKTPANVTNFKALPIIKNMPVGAPIPPNVGVSLGTVSFIRN